MNKRIIDAKWKHLAGLVTESEYFDELKKISNTENVSKQIIPENFNAEDYDGDEDLVDLDMDDSFNYKYSTFQEFINAKYGSDLSLEEKVRALEEWATGYNIGENPGDFSGIAEIMTPEIFMALQTSDVSQIFIDELKKEKESQDREGSSNILNHGI